MIFARLALRLAALAMFAAFGAAPVHAISFGNNFANFSTLPGGSIVWQNDIAPPINGNGAGGAMFGTTTPATPNPGVIPILFQWVGAGIVTPIAADFRLYGATSNQPAVTTGVTGAPVTQVIQSGFFDIVGQNNTALLSGTFTGAEIMGTIGGSTAFTFGNGAAAGMTVNFTSGFAVVPPGPYYFFIQKAGITPGLSAGPGLALADFDPPASGGFGVVPEPGSWALMITGFGLVGGALRRRGRGLTA